MPLNLIKLNSFVAIHNIVIALADPVWPSLGWEDAGAQFVKYYLFYFYYFYGTFLQRICNDRFLRSPWPNSNGMYALSVSA